MIRKFFWLLVFVGVYFYLISSDERMDMPDKVRGACKVAQKKWNEMDVHYHVHTPKCFMKKKNQKKYKSRKKR